MKTGDDDVLRLEWFAECAWKFVCGVLVFTPALHLLKGNPIVRHLEVNTLVSYRVPTFDPHIPKSVAWRRCYNMIYMDSTMSEKRKLFSSVVGLNKAIRKQRQNFRLLMKACSYIY